MDDDTDITEDVRERLGDEDADITDAIEEETDDDDDSEPLLAHG